MLWTTCPRVKVYLSHCSTRWELTVGSFSMNGHPRQALQLCNKPQVSVQTTHTRFRINVRNVTFLALLYWQLKSSAQFHFTEIFTRISAFNGWDVCIVQYNVMVLILLSPRVDGAEWPTPSGCNCCMQQQTGFARREESRSVRFVLIMSRYKYLTHAAFRWPANNVEWKINYKYKHTHWINY